MLATKSTDSKTIPLAEILKEINLNKPFKSENLRLTNVLDLNRACYNPQRLNKEDLIIVINVITQFDKQETRKTPDLYDYLAKCFAAYANLYNPLEAMAKFGANWNQLSVGASYNQLELSSDLTAAQTLTKRAFSAEEHDEIHLYALFRVCMAEAQTSATSSTPLLIDFVKKFNTRFEQNLSKIQSGIINIYSTTDSSFFPFLEESFKEIEDFLKLNKHKLEREIFEKSLPHFEALRNVIKKTSQREGLVLRFLPIIDNIISVQNQRLQELPSVPVRSEPKAVQPRSTQKAAPVIPSQAQQTVAAATPTEGKLLVAIRQSEEARLQAEIEKLKTEKSELVEQYESKIANLQKLVRNSSKLSFFRNADDLHETAETSGITHRRSPSC